MAQKENAVVAVFHTHQCGDDPCNRWASDENRADAGDCKELLKTP